MVQIATSEWIMVRVPRATARREYEVYDVMGRHLGRVLEPVGPPRLGAGAATVLLHRPPEPSRGG